jgi:hypothetical protein
MASRDSEGQLPRATTGDVERAVALVLSAGRTGTKFLAGYLDGNYPHVIARHEPKPSRLLRLASHAHMVGALPRGGLVSLLRRKRRRYVDPLESELYVECNPFLAGFADVIGDVWPDPTIIHMVRDPREHVRSSLNHGTASGWKGFGNRYIPYWYPAVEKILKLEGLGVIGKTAGVWTVMNRQLRDARHRYSRYCLVHYEKVFDANHTGLREICEWLGLDYLEADAPVSPKRRVNAGRLDVVGHWRDWSPADCLELERVCQPMMAEYGYGDEPEWRAKLDSGIATTGPAGEPT